MARRDDRMTGLLAQLFAPSPPHGRRLTLCLVVCKACWGAGRKGGQLCPHCNGEGEVHCPDCVNPEIDS